MKNIENFLVSILSIGGGFYKALVFMFMYNWFISTTFELPSISYWLSYALILTIGTLRLKGVSVALVHYEQEKIGDEERFGMRVGNIIGQLVVLTLSLFVGWIIYLNM